MVRLPFLFGRDGWDIGRSALSVLRTEQRARKNAGSRRRDPAKSEQSLGDAQPAGHFGRSLSGLPEAAGNTQWMQEWLSWGNLSSALSGAVQTRAPGMSTGRADAATVFRERPAAFAGPSLPERVKDAPAEPLPAVPGPSFPIFRAADGGTRRGTAVCVGPIRRPEGRSGPADRALSDSGGAEREKPDATGIRQGNGKTGGGSRLPC